MHGSTCRAYLAGRDISADIASISPKFDCQTHDVTNLASGGWVENDPGLLSWSADIEAFYDPAVGGIGRQFEDLLGASGGVLSIFDGGADGVGDVGVLFSDAILESRDQPIDVGEMIKLKGALKGTGKVGLFGRLLHPLGAEATTGTGASHDNSASSANGGRATAHITAITGTWTLRMQHSNDNGATDPWSDIAIFSGKTAIGGFTTEVTGTIKRYLRATWTADVAGSCTFVIGFARY